ATRRATQGGAGSPRAPTRADLSCRRGGASACSRSAKRARRTWPRRCRELQCRARFESITPMLDNLTTRLAKILKTIRGEARLTEANIQDALREVRIALPDADVALPVVKHFRDSVCRKAPGGEAG